MIIRDETRPARTRTTMSGKGWWNSAISGLESRLDTILTEDGHTNSKPKGAADGGATAQDTSEKAAVDKKLGVETGGVNIPRNSSRSRPNSRLQDRLAKAVNKGTSERVDSRASSDLGSRPESPAAPPPAIVAVTSIAPDDEASPRPSLDMPLQSPPLVSEQPTATPMPSMSIPSIVTPQHTSPRPSLDSNLSRPSLDTSPPAEPSEPSTRDPDILLAELTSLQEAHEETVRGHRDELNAHLERIDALQSKLAYLAQQLATSAKAATTEPDTSPADKKLAEKDIRISALMEEGQRLSKTEMKHLTTVKNLRAKVLEHNKEITTLKQRLSKAEKSITEQSERAKRAEAAERAAQDKLKILGKIEKDIQIIQAEREEAGLTIAELRRQLNDALSRAENAEQRVQTGALDAEKKATASLKEDIENLKIEKKLAEDRAKRDLQSTKDEAKSQEERAKLVELELRGEVAVSVEGLLDEIPR